MKSEAIAVVIKETENLVIQERVEIAKKLKKHKHLHHNNTHALLLLLLYKIVIF